MLALHTLVCGLFAAVAAPDPSALPSPLGLREALAIFRQRGLDALIADEAVAVARADELVAGAIPNPSLSASVGRTFGYDASCAGCSGTAFGAGLSDSAALSDTLTGKRGLRLQTAARALEAARLTREDARRTLELQLAQALVTLAAAEAQLGVAREVAASLGRTRQVNEKRLQAGAVSEADVARAEAAELQALQVVDQASQAWRAAQIGVAFLLGSRAASAELRAEPKLLDYSVPTPLGTASREALLADAEAARPDLKAARAQQERARSSIALAERQRLPDLAVSLAYAQEGTGASSISPPTLTLGVQLPLPIFYRQQGEIARAQADERTQRLQERKLLAQVAADVDASLAAFTSARARALRSEGRLLDRARRARDLVQVQHEKGAASLLEVLDAQRTYAAVASDRFTQLAAYWSAAYALLAATGKELAP